MAQYDLHAVNIKENPSKTPKAKQRKGSLSINELTQQKSEQKGNEEDNEYGDEMICCVKCDAKK